MKKGVLKRVLGVVTTAAVLLTGALTSVSAAGTSFQADQVDTAYYTSLKDKDGKSLTGSPSLTLKKYVSDANGAADTTKPIQNVNFKYKKIGDLYQITDGNSTVMAYGVENDFAGIANATADYSDSSYSYYKDPDVINRAIQAKSKEAVRAYLADADGNNKADVYNTITDKDGIASAGNANAYGLYLVAEWDSPDATAGGKNVSLTGTQNPFVVALPTSVTVTNEGVTKTYWEKDVVATVKNNTEEATAEKKIVKNNDVNAPADLDDTNTVSIGDTVTFQLKGTVPHITASSTGTAEKINKYVLTDNISKGLEPVTDANGLVVTVKTSSTALTLDTSDYTVNVAAYDSTQANADANYAGGKTITVTLTDAGLNKINTWAQNTETDEREICFYYQAKVTDQAAIGPNGSTSPVGNPNELKLTYQIGSSAEMDTDWDKVTVYSFGIKLTKQLSGKADSITNDNRTKIKFALYSKDGENKKYYTVTEIPSESGSTGTGSYKITGGTVETVNNEQKMSPAAGGVLQINGLKAGTYYLEELETVPGYNLLKKPVEIVITANKDNNTYTGSDKQYIGTINQDKDTGIFELTVNNTKGFQLPSTGGAGIWLSVMAGVLIVVIGCAYYVFSTRKKSGNK